MDPTNANTALASAFVEELARCGVRRAVLSPGSRSTPLALALRREPAIDVSVILDERCAGFFALGAAQESGEPVAVLCTSGTAAANLHPAVCEADESALPLLVLTADRPPELRAIGAGQTIDQLKLYGSSVRWFCEVGTQEADDSGMLHLRSTACRAVAAARGEPRPGPAHLNLSWREPLAPLPVAGAVTATDPLALKGRGPRPLTATTSPDVTPAELLLDEIAGQIAAAESGVIVAGRQRNPELREPLARLARASGFPILAEPTSQLRCGPHDRELVIGAYDLLLRDDAFADSVRPDLVLRFGEMPTSKPLRAWLAGCAAEEIAVDPFAGWNEPTRHAVTILRADPVGLAAGWAGRLGGDRAAPVTWVEAERAAREAVLDELSGLPAPTEPGLQLALADAYRDGDLVYTASSMPIRDQEAFLPAGPADVRFLCNRGANGIDGLVSAGAGAALAGERPTTIVTGDLGLLHDLGGLATLREAAAPVRVVVVDNGGGGIFDFLPQAEALPSEEFRELLDTPQGLELERVAALFDLPFTDLSGLGALPEALAAERALIRVGIERSANTSLHERLAHAVAEALD